MLKQYFLSSKNFPIVAPSFMNLSEFAAMSDYGNEKFPTHDEGTTVDRRVLEEISRALAHLRFGSVEITVHDGRVTQIESKRKIRLT